MTNVELIRYIGVKKYPDFCLGKARKCVTRRIFIQITSIDLMAVTFRQYFICTVDPLCATLRSHYEYYIDIMSMHPVN